MPAAKRAAAAARNGAASSPKGAAARAIIDLDKARAARLEVAGDGPIIVWGGQEFQLPPELPVDVMHYTLQGDVHAAVLALFDDDEGEATRFLDAQRITFNDFQELVKGIEPAYGISPGEAPASRPT